MTSSRLHSAGEIGVCVPRACQIGLGEALCTLAALPLFQAMEGSKVREGITYNRLMGINTCTEFKFKGHCVKKDGSVFAALQQNIIQKVLRWLIKYVKLLSSDRLLCDIYF